MTTVFAFVAAHLWQSTLCAAAAGLLTLALRQNRAAVRYGVWLAASAKFLVPFAALMALGGLFGWRTAPPSHDAHVRVFVTGVGALPAGRMPFFTSPITQDAQPESVASPTTLAAMDSVLPWLAVLWLCGTVGVLAVWCVRWRRVARVARRASIVHEGRALTVLRRLEVQRGLTRPIPLLATDATVEPGVFGILKPVLLWPRDIAARLTDEQIDAILAHEISHVRRHDNLVAALHMVVQSLLWFHPLVWWLGARLVDERERACDEEVIGAGAEPQTYAEGILKTCEFYVESPLVCVTGVTGSDLKKRIEQIMRSQGAARLGTPKAVLLALVAIAAIAGPVVVGAATATPKPATFERRVIETRRLVVARPADVFNTRVPAPGVLRGFGEQASASGSGAPPSGARSATAPVLTGTVVGPKRAFVGGAAIVLTQVATNADANGRSDEHGHFEFGRLPAGEYLIGITAAGLEPFHGRVTIPPGQPAVRLDVTLQPQPVQIGMTIGKGFPGPPRLAPPALPPTWSCVDRPLGRECGPPSLLKELAEDREAQNASRDALPTRPALVIKSMPPHYPQELWDAMVEGSVIIEGRIGEDGVPSGLDVIAPVHPDLAKAALETIGQWRFDPARQDGYPISVPLKVSINFRLHPDNVDSRLRQ